MKFIIKYSIILLVLLFFYHWVPKTVRVEAPILYMFLTIIFYNLGKFIGETITED